MPPWLRLCLASSVPLNLGGALVISPLWPRAWLLEGTPEAHSLHGWLLASCVLGFGLAYAWMAWQNKPSRGVLALASYGKLCFGVTLFAHAGSGAIPWTVGITGLPDLVLGALFAGYLLRDHRSNSERHPRA